MPTLKVYDGDKIKFVLLNNVWNIISICYIYILNKESATLRNGIQSAVEEGTLKGHR